MTCMSIKAYIGTFEPSPKQLKAVLDSVRTEDTPEIPFTTTMVDVDAQGNLITSDKAPAAPKPEPEPVAPVAEEPQPEVVPEPEPEPEPTRVRSRRSKRRRGE